MKNYLVLTVFALVSIELGWGQCVVPNTDPAFSEGIITYWVDPDLSETVQTAIESAISDWDDELPNHSFRITKQLHLSGPGLPA